MRASERLGLPIIVVILILGGLLTPIDIRSVLIDTMIFCIFAMGFDVLYGFTNRFSYGQAIFFGLGAYGVLLSILHLKVDLWVGLLIAIALSILFAIAVGFIAVRLSGAYFTIFTIIVNMVFYLLARSLVWLTGGDDGLPFTVPPISLGFVSFQTTQISCYYFVLFFLITSWVILRRIQHSPLGRIMVSIRENEERARFLGYNTIKYILVAYTISALFTALSGALYAIRNSYATADFFSLTRSADPIIWTVIGGAGTLVGPIIGAVFLTIFKYYISAFWKHYLIIIGILMIFLLRFCPKGIVGYVVTKIEEGKLHYGKGDSRNH